VLRKNVLQWVPADTVFSQEELYEKLIPEKELLAYEADRQYYEIGSLEGIARFTTFIEFGDRQP
jgi:hypothetical protein